jgi:predicted membrane protein
MAKPVAREGAIQVLEDAVHLLRRTPFRTLAWHWAGSAPLAVAAAFFWNDITHPATSSHAADALVLALLLAWMNCCRAVFAAGLREGLAGALPGRWNGRRLWSLAASQVFLGATKLVALPIALLSVAPLASTVSFYRNAAALAGRDDLDPRALMAKALQLAGFRPRQSWTLLAFLTLLYPLALVNVVATLAMLPQLIRMLTGHESTISRSGIYFMANPTFWICALAISWMAFDPFVQAAHCVRCFQAESAGTGEDVKAGLRRLAMRTAAVGLLAALLCGPVELKAQLLWGQAFGPAAGLRPGVARQPEERRLESRRQAQRPDPTVSPDQLERGIRQAVQSPEYDWRNPPPDSGSREPWIVTATDRALLAVRSFLRAAGRLIGRFLRWVFQSGGSPSAAGVAPAISLPMSLWILTAAMLVVCGWLVMRFRASHRPTVAAMAGGPLAASPLDAEDVNPLDLPEQGWIEMAESSLREGNWRLAMRAFYLASLSWLGRREFITIHPGKTNREYETELRRRTRAAPRMRELFAGNLAAYERCWYGMHDPLPEDVMEFRRRSDDMKTAIEAAL